MGDTKLFAIAHAVFAALYLIVAVLYLVGGRPGFAAWWALMAAWLVVLAVAWWSEAS